MIKFQKCIFHTVRIDMDDRAKMLQYFAKSNDETANISIEDLFQRSPLRWSYVTMLHDVTMLLCYYVIY